LPYSWNGSRNAAGTYTFTTTNSQGCDSVATLNLTVKTNTTSTTNVSICQSALPYNWNGSRNAAGTYTFTTTNSQGCDSVATLNLTVKTNTTSTTNVSICPSALPYSWNGSRAAAGTYTFTTTNSQGCDSVATLNLTVKTNTTSTTNVSICPSQLPYSWNGSRSAAGTYTFTTTNSQGCDSIATLVLTVKTNTTSTTNVSICSSALPYSWNGSRAAAGTYIFTTTNSQGCDSVATLNLTVKTNTTSTNNVSICPSALPYSWNGSRSAAGTYTFTTTNSQGCDSVATLNLTVKTNTTSTTNVSICPSALPYSWNGSRSAAGTYTFTTTNSQGCDSVATLNLTVKTNTTSTTNVTICEYNAPHVWNGNSYSISGVYTLHFTNNQGCDSAATLNLTITPKPNAGADHSITCGTGILMDTIKAISPLTGTWIAMASNPSGATIGATTSGAAVVNIPPPPYIGTIAFIYVANGCNDTMQINVGGIGGNPMPAINGGTNPICKNATVQLCPTVWGWANYQWYKNGIAIPPAVGVSSCITLDSTGVGSYTLTATNGAGCWTAASTPIVVTYNAACNLNPPVCLAGTSSPCLNTSYVCLGTNTTYDLTTITLTCAKPAGTVLEWHTANPATAANKMSNAASAPLGSYWAVYLDTVNNCYGNNGFATQNVTVDTCSSSVTSGSGGGLESKTLGDIIAVRLYGNAVNSKTETTAYTNTNKFVTSGAIVNGTQDLSLNALIPSTVSNTDAAYTSTPSDLVNFTNAVEVLAVDYTKAGATKAVAFGTKTLGDVYAHTKPICDRLKGASLLEVKTINVRGHNLVAYKVQQCSGEIEYAINLSAGTATNRNSISLQSKWFTDGYQQDEKLYNFQLWAVSYNMVKSMANDILQKLEANGTIIQVNTANDLPDAYVSKGNRNENTISLTIQNNTTATSGYLELKEKLTETSYETIRIIPINNFAANQSTVQLDVKDAYEATISLYINNSKTDMLYLNDGTWSNSYSTSTKINNFTVAADGNSNANSDEYRIMRNVSFSANTKDYFSVYKTIGMGCNALNISKYKSIKFNANAVGAGSVTVTLISSNITDWKNQNSYTMNLDGNQEYAISLAKFKSDKYNTLVNVNEISAVNFSFNNSRGVPTTMTASLSKARFSKLDAFNASLNPIKLDIYPNPAKGKFTASFSSNMKEVVNISVTEIATGKTIYKKSLIANKGENEIIIDLNDAIQIASGLYIVCVKSDTQGIKPAKLMVNK